MFLLSPSQNLLNCRLPLHPIKCCPHFVGNWPPLLQLLFGNRLGNVRVVEEAGKVRVVEEAGKVRVVEEAGKVRVVEEAGKVRVVEEAGNVREGLNFVLDLIL